ncbi:tyrosine-type recombinase/integrase [Clostridium perfringens]|uniref:Site-specific integrase n=1 Tax=Clostridium perfringens TaxID=1502 RepID=A0AAN5N9H1_CLOPF|nr:tyrosine-type recombinase/integrase [Clostridium perfringens]ASY50454.1 integrase [Clostridium perfringens]AWS24948.1 site-specific integrase [Clostridium perfringens]EHK2404568.1 site-specific integrase [Clostridium perfringens]EJT6153914.1 site-specific integrase [Clostridium perfringens]ELC8348016.1 site-specific integrase [Clostridium perfringens]
MQGSIRKRGNTWYYSFDLGKVDGKRKRKEKGGFKTKTEAQKALREAINNYENCGTIVNDTNITFSDYLDYWFKEYVEINCKFNTKEFYRRTLKNHIKPSLGTYKLKSLSPAVLQEFLNKKYTYGLSKSTLQNFYGILSGSLKMAVYPFNFIKENPMQYVSLPKFNQKKINGTDKLKIISLSDFKKILNRFPVGSNFYIPLQIAFNTGLRGGEVCALTWDDINFDSKTLSVNHTLVEKGRGQVELGTPKTNSSYRTISIGETLVKILKDHKIKQKENKLKYGEFYTNSNFICTKENGQLLNTSSLKYLSRIVNYELGIPFNFHALRHTHATMLLEGGANIKDIQKRLGHSRLSTTMDTYSHVTEKIQSETVDILEKIIADN